MSGYASRSPMLYLAAFLVSTPLGACGSEGTIPRLSLSLTPVVQYNDPHVGTDSAIFVWPSVVRLAADGGGAWVLDHAVSRVHYVPIEPGLSPKTFGRAGSGPGELRGATSLDVGASGRVVVADAGNGKLVVFDTTGALEDIVVPSVPTGVVLVEDEIWVLGDLIESIFVRYARDGRLIGRVELGETDSPPRFNRGVAAPGSAPCVAIVAFSFRSEIRCFGIDGVEVWRTAPPNPISPTKDMHPLRISEADIFAYADVAMTPRYVYALFVGQPATRDGIAGDRLHVFRAEDGAFVGGTVLPERINHFSLRDQVMVTVTYRPEPAIIVYRVEEEPNHET